MKFNLDNSKKWLKNTLLGTVATVGMTAPAFASEKHETKNDKNKIEASTQETTLENNSEVVNFAGEREAHLKKLEQQIEEAARSLTEEEHALAVDSTEKNMYFTKFKKHVHHAAEHLGGKLGKEFDKVSIVPELMEKKMEADAKLEFAKADYTSKAALDHWKEEFLDLSNKSTGPLISSMTMISNENNLTFPNDTAATFNGTVNDGLGNRVVSSHGTTSGDITEHQFFGEASGHLIKHIGKVIMQERKVEAKKQALSQLEKNLQEYLIADNLISSDMVQN